MALRGCPVLVLCENGTTDIDLRASCDRLMPACTPGPGLDFDPLGEGLICTLPTPSINELERWMKMDREVLLVKESDHYHHVGKRKEKREGKWTTTRQLHIWSWYVLSRKFSSFRLLLTIIIIIPSPHIMFSFSFPFCWDDSLHQISESICTAGAYLKGWEDVHM